jgi:MHS family proline/betaine transporter-like MFS transporter
MYSNLEKRQTKTIVLIYLGHLLSVLASLLYVHFTLVLTKLFFSPNSFYLAAAGIGAYMLKPIGGLVFGYIADKIGRKHAIVLSASVVAVTSCTMAMLPTYGQIGVIASIMMVLCKSVHGFVSSGQSVASEVYLTESIPKPFRAFAVSTLDIASIIAAMCALTFGYLLTKSQFGWWTTTIESSEQSGEPFWWRSTFLIAGLLGFVAYKINSDLKETPEFSLAKKAFLQPDQDDPVCKTTRSKSIVAFLTLQFIWSTSSFLLWGYSTAILQNRFFYSSSELILHHLSVAIIMLASYIGFAIASIRINPLKILKTKIYFFALSIMALAAFSGNVSNIAMLFLLQTTLGVLFSSNIPATADIYSNFPTLHRTKIIAFVHGLAGILAFAGYILLRYKPFYAQQIENRYWWPAGLVLSSVVCLNLLAISHFEKKGLNHR